ncbi:MAG TPA: MBL fold metallo-hydrolase [Azospirillaceae bacterium]|nr:MBL fold metallo-hydrolase [Azospirillaceae bacterium]
MPRTPAQPCDCSRRGFLGHALGCGAYVMAGLALASVPERRAFAADKADAALVTTPFARIEKVADGAWAVISTPFGPNGARGDRTTLSNGGIIAGRDGVLLVEGFMTPEGAAWLSAAAEQLTGRRPTHVVVTHYHADHVGGLAGYSRDGKGPEIVATSRTKDLVAERVAAPTGEAKNGLRPTSGRVALPTLLLEGDGPAEIDLGGRTVRLVPASGHTDSDLRVELVEPRVVFAGDLVWQGIFPNYVDAVPSKWAAAVRDILKEDQAAIVPGHGGAGTGRSLRPFLDLLGSVEQAARAAHKAGKPADIAGAEFKPDAALGNWTLFSPRFHGTAFAAWYKELG